MAEIFLSYASQDRDRVRPLVETLEAEGWSTWWDREIHAGPRFDQVIEEEIDKASCVVVVWSEHSIRSRWVRDEANEGLERDILVPLRIDDVRPPMGFRSAQTANLTGWPKRQREAELNAFISGVRDLLGVSATTTSASPAARENSIAVLPFINMSNDSEQEYFSDGIADEVLNRMIQVSGVKVISRNSSFAYKDSKLGIQELGKRLGANYVLQGSVRRAGSVVRISVHLTNIADSSEIWANSYDREITNILEVQDEIAVNTINEVAPRIAVAQSATHDVDPHAYELYLRGNDYFNRGLGDPTIVIAIELYEESLAISPSFVLCHAALVKALARAVYQDINRTVKHIDRVRTAAEKALGLDNMQPAVLAAQGWYHYWVLGDYQAAFEWFESALAGRSNDSELLLGVGLAERQLAQWDDALHHLLLSFQLDPLSNEKAIEVGISLEYQHDYARAVNYFETAVGLAPDQYRAYSHWSGGLVSRDDRLDGALQALRKGGEILGRAEFVIRMLSTQIQLPNRMLMLEEFAAEIEELAPESLTQEQAIHWLILRAEQHRRDGDSEAESETARLILEHVGDSSHDQARGLAYAHLGKTRESLSLLDTPVDRIDSNARAYQSLVFMDAYGRVLLGDRDGAVDRISHVLSVPGAVSISYIRLDRLWESLRDHPGFQSLVTKYSD